MKDKPQTGRKLQTSYLIKNLYPENIKAQLNKKTLKKVLKWAKNMNSAPNKVYGWQINTRSFISLFTGETDAS